MFYIIMETVVRVAQLELKNKVSSTKAVVN